MDHERALTPSAFPGDDGQANPVTREALDVASAPTSPADYLRAVALLCLDRVLVPVVATATKLAETASTGLTGDKEAEMSVVLLQTRDGRRAMLAFTGLDSLQAWDASARPVPVTLDLAAQSAAADGATALLVDFAGPSPLVIEGEVLAELARGHRLVEVGPDEFGWAMPQPADSAGPPAE
ncbi:MAG: SseB family protein [Propionibacteriaceae bacterium]